MEAANRGAREAGGKTIGLNIRLPFEQFPNPYITPELSFEFHYFFMRKFWFAYLAKALVVFPGGFGTMDELMEILTLTQTQKLAKKMTVVLYGSTYWKEIINFDALVKYGMISPEDLNLFQYADDPQSARRIGRAHRPAVHRRAGVGRLIAQRVDVLAERAAQRFGEGDRLERQRLDPRQHPRPRFVDRWDAHGARQSPEAPPDFSSSRTPSITMPRSAAFSMS